ncbi:MAG: TraY domain-containing protein [Verrucomicrobiales bacterium]
MLTLRLKPLVEQRLEALARRTGRTKTFYAARAIEERLPEFEQVYAELPGRSPHKVKTAITALKELRRGVTKPAGMTVQHMKEEGRS